MQLRKKKVKSAMTREMVRVMMTQRNSLFKDHLWINKGQSIGKRFIFSKNIKSSVYTLRENEIVVATIFLTTL